MTVYSQGNLNEKEERSSLWQEAHFMQISTGSSGNIHPTTSVNNEVADTPTEETSNNLQLEENEASYQGNRQARFPALKAFWQRWYPAIKGILPIYIAIHLAI